MSLFFFIALGPNQYDALNNLTLFTPFSEWCLLQFQLPTDGVTGDVCPAGAYCPPGSPLPIPCPPGTYSNVSGLRSLHECLDCPPGWVSSLESMAQFCPLAKGLFSPCGCYLLPSCRGLSSLPRALVQMRYLCSLWLRTCISRFTIRNLNCLSCLPAFTVHWLLSRLIMSVVQMAWPSSSCSLILIG